MEPDNLTRALAAAIAALPRGGEARDGQVRMAVDVAAAIEGRHHLVVQAGTGTGTGKSLAYLVPRDHWAKVKRDRAPPTTATKSASSY